MMNMLWRALLILSAGLAGMYLAFWIGVTFFAPKNAGLAAGAIILSYGLMGFVGAACIGAVAAFWLPKRKLRPAALILGFPVIAVSAGLGIFAILHQIASREPDEAFAPAGNFALTMERVDRSDPYLFVEMRIDSKSRQWRQVGPAPQNKVCQGGIQSANLIAIREALNAVLALPAETRAGCASASQPAIKRLRWTVNDAGKTTTGTSEGTTGTLDISQACLSRQKPIARALSLTERVSLKSSGKVSCR